MECTRMGDSMRRYMLNSARQDSNSEMRAGSRHHIALVHVRNASHSSGTGAPGKLPPKPRIPPLHCNTQAPSSPLAQFHRSRPTMPPTRRYSASFLGWCVLVRLREEAPSSRRLLRVPSCMLACPGTMVRILHSTWVDVCRPLAWRGRGGGVRRGVC